MEGLPLGSSKYNHMVANLDLTQHSCHQVQSKPVARNGDLPRRSDCYSQMTKVTQRLYPRKSEMTGHATRAGLIEGSARNRKRLLWQKVLHGPDFAVPDP